VNWRAEGRRAEAKLRGKEYNFGTVWLKRDDAVFCIGGIPARHIGDFPMRETAEK
jgi:hypothetical protein